MFPRPFGWTDRNGSAWFGIVLAALLLLWRYASSSGLTVYTYLVDLTVVVVLAGIVLYAFLNARRERSGQIPEPVDNPLHDLAAPTPADTRRERVAGQGEKR